MILHTAGNIHAKTLTDYIEQIKNLHEEAQDNVKFLSTIRKPTQVLVDSMDFKVDRYSKVAVKRNHLFFHHLMYWAPAS